MSRIVHKHRLDGGEQDIATHEGARVLHVAEQHDHLRVWLDVDTTRPSTLLRLLVRGTGSTVPDFAVHVGSAVCAGGLYVFHVYRLDEACAPTTRKEG